MTPLVEKLYLHKRLSLRRNFTWTLVGNLIYAASSWGMLIVLAKLGTPEVVGRFSLGLAVTAPIIMFANLQLRAIQATDTQGEYLFRDYLGLRILMLLLALAVISIIAFTTGYESETAIAIFVIGLGKAIDSISDVIYGQLQQNERMDKISISLILKGILSLIMLTAGYMLVRNVIWAAIGWSSASLIVVIIYDIRCVKNVLRHNILINIKEHPELDISFPRFSILIVRRLLLLSLPLGISMLLISLNGNMSQYFIEFYLGEHNVGIYSALSYLLIAGTMAVSALGQVASPKLAKYYSEDKSVFLKLTIRLVIVGIILALIALIIAVNFGKPVLLFLYGIEYATYNNLFILIALSSGLSFVASFLGVAVTASRSFRIQPIIAIVIIITTVIFNILLTRQYKLIGSSISNSISSVIQIILLIIVIFKTIQKSDIKME